MTGFGGVLKSTRRCGLLLKFNKSGSVLDLENKTVRLLHRSGTKLTEKGDSNRPEVDAEFYDIVIAGGGLIGTTLAVALGKLGRLSNKRILLLESLPKLYTAEPVPVKTSLEDNPNYSNRVVAISPGSRDFLSKLNIWDHVWRSQPVSTLHVWDALSDANIEFCNPNYTTPVAHIVENAVLGYAISKELSESSNVEVTFGNRIQSCKVPGPERPNEKAIISLHDGKTIVTDLLIGADGYNSLVRKSINSPYVGFNYDRTALVATLKLNEAEHNQVAWQRFLPSGGPIALLPLNSHFSSLVWSTTPENAKKLLQLSDDDFVESVNSAFWSEHTRSPLVKKSSEFLRTLNLGIRPQQIFPPSIIEVVEKSRATFPLGFGHSAYYVSRRAVLIGDAAHRVHPLAGQGLNLGIGDIETLQRVLNNAVGIAEDIGNLEALKEYETERQRHNLAIQGGIEFLHRLYSFDLSPVVAVRSLGLSLVSSSDVLKRFIMSQAAA